MKLYTDASTDEDNNVFGIGYVLELKTGAIIEGKRYMLGDYTSMEAEWYGIMQGIDMAQENITSHDTDIRVITDCQPLVDKMRDPDDMYEDKWFSYRSNMLKELFEFGEWELDWEKREQTSENERADRLAREAMWEGRGDDEIVGGSASRGVTFDNP